MRSLFEFIYRLRFVVLVVIVVLSIIFYRQQPKQVRFQQTQFMMGTTVAVDICANSSAHQRVEEAYGQVWARLGDIAWRMNVYDEKSDVTKINQATSNDSIIVGADTNYVVAQAKKFYQMTDGAFDITIWPLLKFWREHAKSGVTPNNQQVDAIRSQIGLDKIVILEQGSIKKTQDNIQIDLGGIAKGYAIDEAARLIRENGFEQFYINAGGDIYVGADGCFNHKWRIGIQKPDTPDEIVEVVFLHNAAVTTSGNYEQYYELNDKKMSHIIDPRTGYPQAGVVSSTVIAPTALEADVLSTALSVLNVEEGLALADQFGNGYAALIFTNTEQSDELERYESSQLDKYLKGD